MTKNTSTYGDYRCLLHVGPTSCLTVIILNGSLGPLCPFSLVRSIWRWPNDKGRKTSQCSMHPMLYTHPAEEKEALH